MTSSLMEFHKYNFKKIFEPKVNGFWDFMWNFESLNNMNFPTNLTTSSRLVLGVYVIIDLIGP